MIIVVVLSKEGDVSIRHTESFSKVMQGISNFQDDVESFTASSKHLLFKSDFCPLPIMLAETNKGFRKQGLVMTKNLVGNVLVTMTMHIESGEFYETWAGIPDEKDKINDWKGRITSVGRYTNALSVNMGSDVDEDNGITHKHQLPKTYTAPQSTGSSAPQTASVQTTAPKSADIVWIEQKEYDEFCERVKSGIDSAVILKEITDSGKRMRNTWINSLIALGK